MLTTGVLVMLATGLLLLPLQRSGRGRLRDIGAGSGRTDIADDESDGAAEPGPAGRATGGSTRLRPAPAGLGVAMIIVGLQLWWLPALPALVLGGASGVLTALGVSGRVAASARRAAAGEAALVLAVADEMRAGRTTAAALVAAAGSRADDLAVAFRAAAQAEEVGADPADTVATTVGGPVAEALAAALRISRHGGGSLAEVLDTVADDLRARSRRRRALDALLAGPRASAGLLAALPLLGLAMGGVLGADPLHVLTRTGPGQVALLLGVVLDVLGVVWTARLVRAAQR